MARNLFGPGARGDIVREIQAALWAAGFDAGEVDGKYGRMTLAGVSAFQRSAELPQTGVVDDLTWKALLKRPSPDQAERSLQLTAAFDNSDYSSVKGNTEGSWLKWGVAGFSMKHGEMQRIVLEVYRRDPALLDQAFGMNATELVRVCESDPLAQKAWAYRNSIPGGGVVQPWRSQFARFGSLPEVQKVQRRHAFDNHFRPALKTAKAWGICSELGIALCFDIEVDNGGLSDDAERLTRAQMQISKPQTERGLREVIANAVADCSREDVREAVRARKLTIARGFGHVGGRDYLLENWGLADIEAHAAAA